METETLKDEQAVADFIVENMPANSHILVWVENKAIPNYSGSEKPDFTVSVGNYGWDPEIILDIESSFNEDLDVEFSFKSWDDLEKGFPNLAALYRLHVRMAGK